MLSERTPGRTWKCPSLLGVDKEGAKGEGGRKSGRAGSQRPKGESPEGRGEPQSGKWQWRGCLRLRGPGSGHVGSPEWSRSSGKGRQGCWWCWVGPRRPVAQEGRKVKSPRATQSQRGHEIPEGTGWRTQVRNVFVERRKLTSFGNKKVLGNLGKGEV